MENTWSAWTQRPASSVCAAETVISFIALSIINERNPCFDVGEVAQQLGVLTVLAGDLGSVPNTDRAADNSFQRIQHPLLASEGIACIWCI